MEERMADGIGSLFSGVEIQKRNQIISLMSDWQSEIARKYTNEPDVKYWEGKDPLSYFISDGFFPGYYDQKIKVLFIGRETRYMDGEGDWVQHIIGYFKNKNPNQKSFTRRLLSIIQGIKSNGKLKFEDLETANSYAKKMVNTNDYGFAFMNMSKYTNCKDDGANADFDFVNKFLEDSNLENRNYFREELGILSPNIIITLNLWNGGIYQKYLDLCFGTIEWEKFNNDIDGKVNMSNIISNGKSIKLLNTYHLSSHYSDKEYFYNPVMELIFNEESI
jgi:hypothetical protein